jgi:hypothetical protein
MWHHNVFYNYAFINYEFVVIIVVKKKVVLLIGWKTQDVLLWKEFEGYNKNKQKEKVGITCLMLPKTIGKWLYIHHFKRFRE